MPTEPFRLGATSFAVLGLINLLGEATPYDLKRALEQSVENFWPVPHTTFYAEPARLAAAGYLTDEQESGGRRRRLYRITDQGRAALREWVDSPDLSPPQLREEAMLKIFLGAHPEPVLAQRVEWHRAKLAELEGYLENVRASGAAPGVERSLIAGTTYHRLLGDAMASFLDQQPSPRGQPAPRPGRR
jgi:DNA-binding PadR family transcriptional regulator